MDFRIHRVSENLCDGVVRVNVKGVVGHLLCSSKKNVVSAQSLPNETDSTPYVLYTNLPHIP